MSLSNTYWTDCEETVAYDGQACLAYEFGKVRSAAFMRKRYLAAVLADPTSVSVWQAGINSGDIIILPFVSGSFDPGEPAQLKGYGRRLATRGPRDMVLTFTDPAFVLNYSFYNRIQTRTDFVPVFRTSSQLHIADSPADLFARDVVDEDLQSTVVWEVKCRWRSVDLPTLTDFSSLSSVFGAAQQQSVNVSFASGYTITLSATRIALFKVGAPGSPMNEGDTVYTNPLLAGKKVLVVVDGLGLPVDYGTGEILDWSLIRHLEKTVASSAITYVGGVVTDEIHEVYALS